MASVHIYTGDGKGKTTAAIGLAVRAASAGLKVIFIQFLKDCTSSEITGLKRLGIETVCFGRPGFIKTQPSIRDKTLARQGIRLASKSVLNYELVVLDEVLVALHLGLVKLPELLELVNIARAELVLTGRGAPPELIAAADYVSEMRKLKHPYDEGKPAREGIEF